MIVEEILNTLKSSMDGTCEMMVEEWIDANNETQLYIYFPWASNFYSIDDFYIHEELIRGNFDRTEKYEDSEELYFTVNRQDGNEIFGISVSKDSFEIFYEYQDGYPNHKIITYGVDYKTNKSYFRHSCMINTDNDFTHVFDRNTPEDETVKMIISLIRGSIENGQKRNY